MYRCWSVWLWNLKEGINRPDHSFYKLFAVQGAAVAYVADLLKVPAIFVKAVTDIVDGDKPTSEEFLENLTAVTVALNETVKQVVDYISGKSVSEL